MNHTVQLVLAFLPVVALIGFVAFNIAAYRHYVQRQQAFPFLLSPYRAKDQLGGFDTNGRRYFIIANVCFALFCLLGVVNLL
ncbi:MAG: hypothetical protein D6800_09340 [Candidatus Zixiibacteriota bacterium]|nr:MAG: hypothetical protein D6800_09340 [candidate division Zixibacteria bacterium]